MTALKKVHFIELTIIFFGVPMKLQNWGHEKVLETRDRCLFSDANENI